MRQGAGGAEASRLGTCAANAPQCAGSAVQLLRHGRFAGAPRRGDATKASAASRRQHGGKERGSGTEAAP
jgi:hypothetical protein